MQTGKTVATGKNKADGTISFGNLAYSLSDLSDGNGGYVSSKDFTYTVSEVLPEGATAGKQLHGKRNYL